MDDQTTIESRKQGRCKLREAQLPGALEKLKKCHKAERLKLSQELRDLSASRTAVKDQLWSDEVKLSLQSPGEGSSSSNVKEEISPLLERDAATKQELLKELLPERKEARVELQRLLEVIDEEQLKKAYFVRLTEDGLELRKRDLEEAKLQAGLWRFFSKKKVEAERRKLESVRTSEDDIHLVDAGDLGVPELPGCYEDIKKLLDIENNPIFKKALEEWNRREELLSHRVERKSNRVDSLKNEIYQLIGFFSVFQGVVLTAVSQSSLLYCSNKWSPISLSVLASVVSIFGVLQKLFQIYESQKNIDTEDRDRQTAVQVGQRLRGQRPAEFDFAQLNFEIVQNQKRQSKLTTKRLLTWLYFVLAPLTLVAFGVLFPVSYWRILCRPGSAPNQGP